MAHTLVTFHAHPDDEALLTAGTMARAVAEGHRVVLVFATRGDVGAVASDFLADGESLAARRTREALASAQVLGVHRVEFLGYGDSGSAGEHIGPESFAGAPVEEAAARLAEILVEESAAVLTVYDANGGYGHPDHLQVRAVGLLAAERAGTPVVLEATIDRDLMQLGVELATGLGYTMPDTFQPESFDRWFTPAAGITHRIDVSGQLDSKRRSMQAHASQTTGDGEGDRTLAAFLSLPDEYFAMAFSTEWYVEVGRSADDPATDVFDALVV